MEILVEKFCEEDLNLIDLSDFDDFWNMNMLKEEISSPTSYFVIAKSQDGIPVRFCWNKYCFK